MFRVFKKCLKKRQDFERGVAYREKLDALEVPEAPEKNLKPATVWYCQIERPSSNLTCTWPVSVESLVELGEEAQNQDVPLVAGLAAGGAGLWWYCCHFVIFFCYHVFGRALMVVLSHFFSFQVVSLIPAFIYALISQIKIVLSHLPESPSSKSSKAASSSPESSLPR